MKEREEGGSGWEKEERVEMENWDKALPGGQRKICQTVVSTHAAK